MNAINEASDIHRAAPFQPKIIRSNRRQSIAIEIKYGEVIVRVPSLLPLAVINKFLDSRHDWIQNVLDSGTSQPKQTLVHNAQIYINGSLVLVQFITGKSHCELINKQLIVSIPARVTHKKDYALRLFNHWLKARAEEVLPDMVSLYASRASLHHRLVGVHFKYTQSKWGHCTSKGLIQLNPRILMAPISVQQYLVAHEVAHLKWMNHSGDFWSLVSNLDPNYKTHRKWLQSHQHETLALSAGLETPA